MNMPMVESEWAVCGDPKPMLRHLGCKAGDRKRRLFACACCRRAWHLLVDPRVRHAVETAERYADKEASESELEEASDCAEVAYRSCTTKAGSHAATHAVFSSTAGGLDASFTAVLAAQGIVNPKDSSEPSECERANLDAEHADQTSLLRDIVGNPFHSVAIELSWLAWHRGAVAKIAKAIYDKRAFDRLPLLAKALADAGCTNEAILAHCRSGGEHVRGCWVVDLLLGMDEQTPLLRSGATRVPHSLRGRQGLKEMATPHYTNGI
jgi:hypothetical protein